MLVKNLKSRYGSQFFSPFLLWDFMKEQERGKTISLFSFLPGMITLLSGAFSTFFPSNNLLLQNQNIHRILFLSQACPFLGVRKKYLLI